MIIGNTIYASLPGEPLVYYSPWFPRRGNSATFVCDVIATGDLASFSIQVQTKAAEESDSAAVAVGSAASVTLTNNTRTPFERGGSLGAAGFKDLVRFKYELLQNDPATFIGHVHFRMLNPAWLTD